MKRRSFFSKLGTLAAAVALAPRLAFRIPDEPIKFPPVDIDAPGFVVYSQVVRYDQIDFLADKHTAEMLKEAMIGYFTWAARKAKPSPQCDDHSARSS